ncbi:hypothetical protein B0T14DRAFT_560113 [Immersiella caudata]|uniref:Uncharacterized protein n=1 Tax=Immersiella caudata TaxID=314043 RepID=A0AA40CB97_9PEZI|nr:hypothetical protein B0T14DRAFT_560113 [Immersiella caudata]
MCFGSTDRNEKYYYHEEIIPVRHHNGRNHYVHDHHHGHHHSGHHHHHHHSRSVSPRASYHSVAAPRAYYGPSPRASVASYRSAGPVVYERTSRRYVTEC